jgi:hypothetical protein
VEFKQETLPSVDEKKWAEMPPSWEEMWNAQEDSWLVTELLQAIQRVNEPTSNRADSYIKKIQTIELAGGNRAALTSGGGKQTGNKPAGPLGNLGIGATSAEGSAGDFKLSDEFGTPTAKDAQAAPATTPVVGAKPSATAPSSRYVDDGPKFRTRAFKLTVDMDHRRLPHLLVELTNSNWPVEIVRVNQVARSENANSGEDEEDEPNDKREISKSALTGPHMATVIVAGLFTLYNPPAVPETPAGEQPAAGAQPAPAAQPATEGTVPATGAAPAGTAAPANNTATPTGPTTNGNSAAPATSPATPAAGATAAPENNAPK